MVAFRIHSQTRAPAEAYKAAVTAATQIRRAAVLQRDAAAGGSVNLANLFNGLVDALRNGKVTLDQVRTVPGIAGYAQSQTDDPTYDVVQAFTDMMAEINATIAWFEANFPAGNQDHLQIYKWVGDGSAAVVGDTLTNPGSLSALQTRLDALIAAIVEI